MENSKIIRYCERCRKIKDNSNFKKYGNLCKECKENQNYIYNYNNTIYYYNHLYMS